MFFLSFQVLLLNGLAKIFCLCFIICYPGSVWPEPLLWTRLTCKCFYQCSLYWKILVYVSITCHVFNSIGGFKQEYVGYYSSTTKSIIYSSPQCLCPPNLAGRRLTIRYSHPLSHVTIWSRCLPRSHGKLNSLYLYYHSPYDHQDDGGLPWGACSYKFHDPLIMWSLEITW